MTIPMISSVIVAILLVPAVIFRLRMAKTEIRRFDALMYSFIATFGIMQISTIISYAMMLYVGWKAEATAMPDTNVKDAIEVLYSEARFPIFLAAVSLMCWYTGIPYGALRGNVSVNSIGTDALKEARAAWQPAMLYCCIMHVVSAFGYIAFIHFLRATVT